MPKSAPVHGLTPIGVFLPKLFRHGRLALLIVLFSLGSGMVGYHFVARLPWIDAFLNASMILTGMGPVAAMTTTASKLFAGIYAMYSGVAFLTSVGIMFAPVLHRGLHRFHLEP